MIFVPMIREPPKEVLNPMTASLADLAWFMVIDLANAFFCLPLHSDLQPIFAFTNNGTQYTYNHMLQGF